MNAENGKNPKISSKEMQRVMSSQEGKELLQLLSRSGGLEAAMEAFRKGDMQGVKTALQPALQTQEAGQLLEKINGK